MWGGGINQERGRTRGHRHQCGDYGGRGWVEVGESVGGTNSHGKNTKKRT